MSRIIEQVEQLVQPVAEDLGLELVDIEYQREDRGWVLRIYLDKTGGINLDDCANASREISTLLDVEDVIGTVYTLEVSSPGIERVIKKLDDFERFRGQMIKIKTCRSCDPDGRGQNRKIFIGVLQGVREGQVFLIQADKKTGEIAFDLQAIEKANLVFEF
ncbi:ribosome maturation factor RimP [Geopsychrobacter electrodiphilus]|uniref:ribosome maturation factor RimP n=1 Tax=Geopsychrobacter electrodiphilus TaxID=225196 RepID=UPI00037BC0B8|nr:ribosome maturation factor RimP [Geopsychrobacter electrodiphilus]